MSAQHEPTTAEVAGNLYGALMDARPYVVRRLEAVREHGTDRLYARVQLTLERVDAALAEASDYLKGDGQ